ncbi:MAG: hypothetical protein Athens101410_740 [Parcubacteria group bacterium Athens1014_10]|nr:MAG: hypothetical protein Athens101410_740 [Parcubacteria group bacterium Athens1014_10]TSD04493.1 MAG: hypothetical protein Athens071412_757 [Parcubacteria group bacterium Athens0714_12]
MTITINSATLFLTFVFNVLLGVFVLLRSKKQDAGLVNNFSLFTLFLSFWIFCFFLSSLTINYQVTLLGARLTSIGALFFPLHFMLFSFVFLEKKIKISYLMLLYLILGIICSASISTNYYIRAVEIAGNNYDYLVGQYYYLVPFLLLSLMASGLYAQIKAYQLQNNIRKNQIRYLFFGVFVALLIGSITNIFLPMAGIRIFNFLGPFGTVFFVGFAAFSLFFY